MEYHDDAIFPLLLLWHLTPPPNTNDDIEQPPAQGGITVEGDFEQLNGDSIEVRQSFHSPTSGWRLSTPALWAELLVACSRATGQGLRLFGSNFSDLALRNVWNHRTHRLRMSSTSFRSKPSSSFTYTELASPPDSSSLDACRSRPDRLLERVSSLRTKSQKKVSMAALRTLWRLFQPFLRPFEGCCCGVLRVGDSVL